MTQTHRSRHRTVSLCGLIHHAADRTPERLKAMVMFERLCGQAFTAPGGHAYELYTEHIPGTSEGAARGRDRVVIAQATARRLASNVGHEPFAILFHRIYQRMEFTEMERDGFGEAGFLGGMFLRALDGVASFYGLQDRSAAYRLMESRIETIERDAKAASAAF